MTPRQQRFVEEYLIDLNATRAAIRAGYSPKWAGRQGARLLAEEGIQKAVAKTLESIRSAKIADIAEVMEYLTAVMRREHRENVVVTVSEETSSYVPDENGTMRKQTVKRGIPRVVEVPIKLSDANKAAELLGKRYNLFTDKPGAEGAVPVVISGADELED